MDDGSKIVTFEFDNNGRLDANADGLPDNPGATLIAFKAADTNAEIAARIGARIELAKLGLDAVPIGDGRSIWAARPTCTSSTPRAAT